MEAAMHGSFDRSGENANRIHRSWSIGFFALPIVLVVALIALATTQPNASNWISEAVQAEFVGADFAPIAPTQLAQPMRGIRISTQVMY
jgi:hypothetical protein